MNNPHIERLKFSIVVPSFNHARFLWRTLDSILGQDYRPIEVIVVDGGSRDGTVELLERYAARFSELSWISEPDDGPADAVNKGLARVTGDIIGIQSSDDVYYSNTFSEVSLAFENNSSVGFVYGDVEGIDEDDNIIYRNAIPDFSWEAFFAISLSIPQSSIFFRKNIADRVAGWNSSYYSCDIDYWMRLLFQTEAFHICRPLSGWRRYADQRTGPDTAEKIWDGYWRMIEESPDIAQASLKIRRLALASCHILALRFPPRQSRWVVWKHLLMGAILHPRFWRYNARRRFLRWTPGAPTLRQFYRRMRGQARNASVRRRAEFPTVYFNDR